jgi:hypothetical protein
MVWGEEQEKAIKEIKRALTNTPALGLPDVMKLFFLYVPETGANFGNLEPAVRFLAPLGGLFSKSCHFFK